MTPFLQRKSPMQKLEAELASLRARAETLNSRRSAADAEFFDAGLSCSVTTSKPNSMQMTRRAQSWRQPSPPAR